MVMLRDNPDFPTGEAVEIPKETGQIWKKAGVVFAENNGWDWEGNTYLIDPFEAEELEEKLKEKGFNLWDYAHHRNVYFTNCFGFNDYSSENLACSGFDPAAEELCQDLMEELGIRWCGWFDAPAYTLVASLEQIQELIRRLEEPIARWTKDRGIKVPENRERY